MNICYNLMSRLLNIEFDVVLGDDFPIGHCRLRSLRASEVEIRFRGLRGEEVVKSTVSDRFETHTVQ